MTDHVLPGATAAPARSPGQTEAWPAADLERVERCPACGATGRSLLLDDLWDNSFFTAPGRWTLWSCAGCGSAYLDPRPTEASIGRAYESYYTHRSTARPSEPSGVTEKLRRALANGYRNARYGTRLRPSLAVGRWLGRFAPAAIEVIDVEFRALSDLPRDRAPRVLDIGCGSGDWLVKARGWGWNAVGSDPDPRARAAGEARGLVIRAGGADAWADEPASFDAITLAHVVEHLHHPREALATAWSLLRPGGTLFIETPNVHARGLAEFGRHWRGLETPRHLILFSHAGLSGLLEEQGFERIRSHPRSVAYPWMRIESWKIARGLDPHGPTPPDVPPLGEADAAAAKADTTRSEFLTLTCRKPR